MQRLHKPVALVVFAGLMALDVSAGTTSPVAPTYGSCHVCCSVYPSGWRGMCVRHCHAYRQWLPSSLRHSKRCECSFNWRGEWSCGV